MRGRTADVVAHPSQSITLVEELDLVPPRDDGVAEKGQPLQHNRDILRTHPERRIKKHLPLSRLLS
jgi:hypothetical protein